MKRINYYFLLTVFVSINLHSQIATNSLFIETKSINPSIIGKRPVAVFSLTINEDRIKKDLDLSTGSFGTGAKENNIIDVKSASLFYGGKSGGFLTSEFTLKQAQGTKKVKVSSSTANFSSSNNVRNTYAQLGYGLGRFLGLSMGLLKYHYVFKVQNDYADFDNKSDTLVKMIKAGLNFKSLLNFGFYAEYDQIDTKLEQNSVSSEQKEKMKIIGGGIGFIQNKFHLQASYEKRLEPPPNPHGKKLKPARIIGTLEFAVSGITLGYTGNYYIDGFIDMENVLYKSLVYGSAMEEPRLEHTFNIAFGLSKGHTFSGSLSYSNIKAEESSGLFGDGIKYPAITKSIGVSLKYSYIF